MDACAGCGEIAVGRSPKSNIPLCGGCWGDEVAPSRPLSFEEVFREKMAERSKMTYREAVRRFEEQERAKKEAEMAEAAEKSKRSRNRHAAPKRSSEGEWSCSVCGAESFDEEMFNEAGEDFRCLETAIQNGLLPDPASVQQVVSVVQARKWIEAARKISDAGLGEKAERVSAELSRLGTLQAQTFDPLRSLDMRALSTELVVLRDTLLDLVEKSCGPDDLYNGSLPVRNLAAKMPRRKVPWYVIADAPNGRGKQSYSDHAFVKPQVWAVRIKK